MRVTRANEQEARADDGLIFEMEGLSWTLHDRGAGRFRRGQVSQFNLDPGTGLYWSALRELRIGQASGVFAGPWKLQGSTVFVNGHRYDNEENNEWLGRDGDWRPTL